MGLLIRPLVHCVSHSRQLPSLGKPNCGGYETLSLRPRVTGKLSLQAVRCLFGRVCRMFRAFTIIEKGVIKLVPLAKGESECNEQGGLENPTTTNVVPLPLQGRQEGRAVAVVSYRAKPKAQSSVSHVIKSDSYSLGYTPFHSLRSFQSV